MAQFPSNECTKAFWYGFLSVLTFGAVPSYLHRIPEMKINQDPIRAPRIGSIENDFVNVLGDIRKGFGLNSTVTGNTSSKA